MVTVRFLTLTGTLAAAKTEDFSDIGLASAAIVEYATKAGYTNVKSVPDDDGYRFTATTPNGRAGRNIAFVDFVDF